MVTHVYYQGGVIIKACARDGNNPHRWKDKLVLKTAQRQEDMLVTEANSRRAGSTRDTYEHM